MIQPIKRIYKPNIPQTVDLGITNNFQAAPPTQCEVTEYDSVLGMEKWKDSVFVQDFADSVVTIPTTLMMDCTPASQTLFDPLDALDPFSSVSKHSS